MVGVRKALAAGFGAVAMAGSVAMAAPAVAWAGPVHAQLSQGFTGFGTGFNGSLALSRARADARAQIAAAGLDLIQNGCHENSNNVEFNDFSRIWQAESIWECVNA